MIIALIEEDTQAIKIASGSAKKLKLNPTTSGLFIKIALPDKASGISLSEKTNETRTKHKARRFRNADEIRPIKGKTNAPIVGTKTILNNIYLLHIIDL